MRIDTTVKWVALASLAVCSVSLAKRGTADDTPRASTTVIPKDARKAIAIPNDTPRVSTTVKQTPGPVPKAKGRTIIGFPNRSIQLEKTNFTVKGNVVTVSATAKIKDSRPNVKVWSIRVYDSTGNVKLSEHPYVDQAFQTNETQNTHPTFEDKIKLAPGNYQVWLILYRLPTNFDVKVLADDVTAKPFISVSMFRTLTIEPAHEHPLVTPPPTPSPRSDKE
jgi:hypothetical protein